MTRIQNVKIWSRAPWQNEGTDEENNIEINQRRQAVGNSREQSPLGEVPFTVRLNSCLFCLDSAALLMM